MGCERYSIYDTYRELSTGFKSVHDIPVMTVTRMNGEWYTYTGNRRLWVFQKLAREGYICDVYVETTDRRVPMSKFTTKDGGRSVKIRGDIIGSSSRIPNPVKSRGYPIGSSSRAPDSSRNVACPVCGEV